MTNDMSLKAKIRNMAKQKNISAQAILQIHLMNHFLFRLSRSSYRERFIIKGGMLISSFLGIAARSTMDIDATLFNLPMLKPEIETAIKAICAQPAPDDITFILKSLEPIRDDDIYGGFRAGIIASYGKINAPLSMDISTGDVITPGAEPHTFSDLFDEDFSFVLNAYPIETILAEKIETVLSRGIDNTRPRDFYDIFMLANYGFDESVFRRAFISTAEHRGTQEKTKDYKEIIETIANDKTMQKRWHNFSANFSFSHGITFEDTLSTITKFFD